VLASHTGLALRMGWASHRELGAGVEWAWDRELGEVMVLAMDTASPWDRELATAKVLVIPDKARTLWGSAFSTALASDMALTLGKGLAWEMV
jgi:hypothetical protein